jgi:hypothetical protein
MSTKGNSFVFIKSYFNLEFSISLYSEALQLSETLPVNEGESSTLDRVHSHVSRLRRAALAANVFAEIKLAQVSIALVLGQVTC